MFEVFKRYAQDKLTNKKEFLIVGTDNVSLSSLEQFKTAINNLKNNESPDSEDIQAELLNKAWMNFREVYLTTKKEIRMCQLLRNKSY